MRRLRIVHLIDLARVGGVESMFHQLIQAEPPRGVEVEHYTLTDSPEIHPRFVEAVRRYSRRVCSPKRWHGLTLPRRPHALRALNRCAQIRAIKPDLVLAWNQFTDFRLDTLQLGCPLVYYEHGMSWYQHSPRQLQGFLPHVTLALAASQASARMLALKHGVTFPIEVCQNPLADAQRTMNAVERRLPHNRSLRLGLAARLVPLKAVGLLVLTIKSLLAQGVDAEAWIAGEGPERAAIDALIEREGLAGRVRMLGLCSDMAGFYREIDLFVQTSMHESLSLVCLEAMAHGVPVICSRVDGMPEVVQDQVTGLCLDPTLGVDAYAALTGCSTQFTRTVYDPARDCLTDARLLDPQHIAAAVQLLAGDGVRYAAFSRAASVHANQSFRFSDYLQRFYTVLAAAAQKS